MRGTVAVALLVVGLLVASHGYGWVLIAAMAVAMLVAAGARVAPQRAVRYHVHAGTDWRKAADHEGGHGAVGKHVKARVGHAEIHQDGSGWIEVHHRRDATPAERIAVSLAGGMAEGVGEGARQCRGDRRHIDAELRGVPRQQHRQVMSDARRIARTGRSRESSSARRISAALQRDGSYR